ncbi:hypothetical protein [Pelagibacterium lacus]|uniref:Uncharacterized protein n=1 Tax=Pelagibacterium lacus TaxID=2282655 RepID=A0A369W544_9HYPH|nr:hypothetical protein [Pelagibacterium lacus]RDE09794.1 hypothetical protein DVH29_04440 [Pelagibacterium lacus]
MSESTGLSDLKIFSPRSPLASEAAAVQSGALHAIIRGLEGNRPVRRRMTDMLSVVLALSTRTRRMVLPTVSIDLDVFDPQGQRALRLYLPRED